MMLALLAATAEPMLSGVLGLLIKLSILGLFVWVLATFVAKIDPYRAIVVGVGAVLALIVILNHFDIWF